MEPIIDIAGDITAAATAMAGLLLVFIGNTTASFESYRREDQSAVVKTFRRRAYLALAGFILSILSAAFSLFGKWLAKPCLVDWAVMSLVLAFVVVLCAAILNVLDIR